MTKIRVLGSKACGSAIAEAFLLLADIPFVRTELDYEKPSPERDELYSLNPLGQVPTLILEDGLVLTETLAIAHYANDQSPNARLLPVAANERIRFFRWSTFIISSVYPCFTYGDSPEKWLPKSPDAQMLKTSTIEQLKKLWLVLEQETIGPYFLGESFSAIDIYFFVMSHWRPGEEWFRTNTPKIMQIREKVEALPKLQKLWGYHFN